MPVLFSLWRTAGLNSFKVLLRKYIANEFGLLIQYAEEIVVFFIDISDILEEQNTLRQTMENNVRSLLDD